MPLQDWIDLTFLKICVRHTFANVIAMTSFKIMAIVVDALIDQEPLKLVVHLIEGVVLVGLLLGLVGHIAVLLWRHRV